MGRAPARRRHHDYRGHAGQFVAGALRVGDEVVVLPEGGRTRIAQLDTFDGPVDEAFAPMSVTALLEDDLDVARGDVLCAADAPAAGGARPAGRRLLARRAARAPSGRYLIKHTTRTTRAELTRIEHRVDVGSLRTEPDPRGLELNDIGRVTLRTAAPLVVDRYDDNRATGSFVLIDEATNATVAAGMVVDPVRDGGARSPNVVWERGEATREDRWAALGQRGATIWLTGLPSSGKSAIAAALEAQLVGSGTAPTCSTATTCATACPATSGSTPARAPRTSAAPARRRACWPTPGSSSSSRSSPRTPSTATACAAATRTRTWRSSRCTSTRRWRCARQRDPKGLYRRARAGTLHGLTGVDDPYEPPPDPDLVLDGTQPIEEGVAALEALLEERGLL